MVYLDNSNKDHGMVIMMWAVFNGVLGQLQQRSWNGNHDVGCFQWCTWTTPTKIRGMVIMMWGVLMVYFDNSNKDQGNGNHDVGCFQWCTWTTPTKIRVMVIMMWGVFNGVLGQLQQRSG